MGTACAGKVAIVTGASRGIGVGIARRLAAEGARVVVTARTIRPGEFHLGGSLEETVAAITAHGDEAVPAVVDLSDPDVDRGVIVDTAVDAFGEPPDILVNNAAAAFYVPFAELSEKRFRIAVELNVRAPWDLAQRVIPGMRDKGSGWILNISSATARPPSGPPFAPSQIGGACVYGGTKAMLDRVTVGAALELQPDNIAVNALSPQAAVATPGAVELVDLPEGAIEPLETMTEAALALCTGDPQRLTGRIAYSLSLLEELGLPVHTLDGDELVAGWQPGQIDERRLRARSARG